jgi:hypothetical protein
VSRIRSIKPEFWVSEQIAECSTNARLTFIGMWTFCDDNGVHPAKPKTLKAELFPMDDYSAVDVASWVDELLRVGLLAKFTDGGVEYWHVTGWHRHQKIDRPSYKYSPPPGCPSPAIRRMLAEGTTNDHRAPPPGVESNGVESNNAHSSRVSRLVVVEPSTADFDSFWQAYPNKKAKNAATKAFAKIKPDAELLTQMLAALKAHGASEAWRKDDGKFIPHPATWLNGCRWHDEMPKPAAGDLATLIGRSL